MMSAATLASPAVAAFAAAVRSAMSDLPADEVDELTDGLEADLTDRLADGRADAAAAASELGDPEAYAAELRAAAGLPHRVAPAAGPSGWTQLGDAVREAPREVVAAFRDFAAVHPSIPRLGAFFLAIRPLWWLFRAVVVTALVINILLPGWWAPVNGFTIVLAAAILVLSVQFGRGRWMPFAWMRGILLAVNVILVVAAPFVVAAAVTSVNNGWYSQTYSADSTGDLSGTGLLRDGNPVSNIFAYDAQGDPLTDVQLFDQDGHPLDLVGDRTALTNQDGMPGIIVPNQSVSGRLGWNVFPLAHVDASDLADDGSVKSSAIPQDAVPPFATARPLAGSEAATPTPTPSPTPAP